MQRTKSILLICIAMAMVLVLIGPVGAEKANTININTASVQELTQLKRIGSKYAERIVEYRDKSPFKSPEEIMNVPGIGPKVFELNKDLIVVE
ncbi:ComEA family DNA-binding protein [Thermodesulfobacteriota bacterium]